MEKLQQANVPVVLERKKGHTGDIISIAVQNDNTILTSSEDRTVRLWDLRKGATVCCFKDVRFREQQMANAIFGAENSSNIFVAVGKSVYQFDMRKGLEKIICTAGERLSNSDNDEINQIAIDVNFENLAACDDAGDVTIFSPQTLEVKSVFAMQHTNISFSTDFVYTDQTRTVPMCISSAFDCKTILWDLQKKAPVRHNNIKDITDKYLPGALLGPPLIYSVAAHKTQYLVGVESGHIICFGQKEIKKPKFIIEAHLGKVMRAIFARFNEHVIVSASTDKTFALWNANNRDEFGVPKFLKKIEMPEKPNWVETTSDNKVLVADLSHNLSIYYLK